MIRPLPEVIYVTWTDDPELVKDGFLDAVEHDPKHWLSYPKDEQTFGVYKLVEVKTLPPRDAK